MSVFSAYCNKKLEKKNNLGIREVDCMIRQKVKDELNNDDVLQIDNLVDIITNLLAINDDRMEKLARARVMFVMAYTFEKMNAHQRRHAMQFVDEEIPSYEEAKKMYDRLDH